MKTSLSVLFILFATLVNAQDPCATGDNGFVFQANRIGAFFNPRGQKFLDEESDPFFKVPYTSEKSASTIFASSPWIGGKVKGNLKLAGPEWIIHNQDYYVGPLGPGAVSAHHQADDLAGGVHFKARERPNGCPQGLPSGRAWSCPDAGAQEQWSGC